MSTTKQSKNINKFVISFLTSIGADTKLWTSSANMKEFRKLFKTKKVKDKDKPKRAKSAYLYFCSEKRSVVKSELGENTNATMVMTKLGQLWRELKEHEDVEELLGPYQELAAADKERYNREIEAYIPPTVDEIKKKRRLSKDKNKPKRVRSKYIFFCVDHRAEAISNLGGETSKATAVTSELGRMWREFKMSASEKEMGKYELLHEEDKKRFVSETDAYVPQIDSSGKVIPKESPKESPKVSPKEIPKEIPKVSKATAYRLYIKTTRPNAKQDYPNISASQLTAILAKKWREMSDEEKRKWQP